jgi:uncharacterized protein YcfL
MKKLLLISLLIVFFFGCNSEQQKNKKPVNSDSLNRARIVADSISLEKQNEFKKAISNLKAKKSVTVSDKTVTVIQNAKTDKEVKMEYEFGSYTTYYSSKEAERDETLLNIRIKLSSKSKWNNGGGDFFPNLNVFRISNTNIPYYVETMTYQLYKKTDRNYFVLEQIFDYRESEVFVCWLSLKTPISSKYVISVNSGGKNDFDVNTVIGIVNPKK